MLLSFCFGLSNNFLSYTDSIPCKPDKKIFYILKINLVLQSQLTKLKIENFAAFIGHTQITQVKNTN